MKSFIAVFVFVFAFTAFAGDKTVKLSINGMTCNSCASTVTKALQGVNGVSDVKVSLKEKSATVKIASTSKTETSALVKAVSDAGFEAAEGAAPATQETSVKKSEDACGGDCCKDGDMKSGKTMMKKEAKKEMKKS